MSFRYKFSFVLFILGLIAAIMSFGGRNSSSLPPEEILSLLDKAEYKINADDLAALIVNEDSALQVVDVRSTEEYRTGSIPGALSVPLNKILEKGNESLFKNGEIKTVFYGNDETVPVQAWLLGMQKGYKGIYILRGGLTEWDSVVLHSEFTGEKISPEQNALFEKRFKARRMFLQWNSMPDSLKAGFFAAKQKKDKELVGGCE
jgi:rhodanese-related sulfurtransferase